MALGHSIEGRYPFLDHRLVDTVFHYPDHFKLNGFSQKHILKETFKDKIPRSVTDRPKRPYMSPDLVSFFQNGRLTDRAQEFLSPSKIEEYGIFDTKFINRFIQKFERGIPKEIGYRDNMIITFILSAQVAQYWAKNPRQKKLDKNRRTVRLSDY
jgi:asparagine synthase (glutamine-hydrolysing)